MFGNQLINRPAGVRDYQTYITTIFCCYLQQQKIVTTNKDERKLDNKNNKDKSPTAIWQGFVFTPATSTAMSIVQIGGFYTANNLGGHKW